MVMHKATLNETVFEAQAKFLRIAQGLDRFNFPKSTTKTFSTYDLNIDNIVQDIPIGKKNDDYIYLFQISGQGPMNKDFIKLFTVERKRQEGRSKKDLPRLNQSNQDSQCLYVGRSKNLRSRLRQHLSAGYKGTYAMHMERWCNSINIDIDITYFIINHEDNLVVQAIEDSLWDKLRPCFGKKGAK